MRRRTHQRGSVLWMQGVLLVGCGASPEEDTARSSSQEAFHPYCIEEVTPVGWDEQAPDGSVPSSWVQEAEAGGTWTWSGAGDTELSLAIRRGDQPEWVEQREAEPPPGAPVLSIAIWCGDFLRVPVVVELATEDGAFDEQITTTLSVGGDPYGYYSSGEPSLDVGTPLNLSLDATAVSGSYDPEESGYTKLDLSIQGGLVPGGTAGTVDLSGEQRNEVTASYSYIKQVAHWNGGACDAVCDAARSLGLPVDADCESDCAEDRLECPAEMDAVLGCHLGEGIAPDPSEDHQIGGCTRQHADAQACGVDPF